MDDTKCNKMLCKTTTMAQIITIKMETLVAVSLQFIPFRLYLPRMDTVTALLLRLGFSADIFFQGAFCGSNHFPAQPMRGHLHLLRSGTLTLSQQDGSELVLEGPAVAWYPRPHAHGLATGEATARLLCASVHLAGEDATVDALPDCVHASVAQLPALGGTLALLFQEARAAGLGHALVQNRLCEILIVQLLRHALERRLIPAAALAGLSDAALGKAMEAMQTHPGGKWTVEKLAALCGMSRSRFARQFHVVVGCPPAQYLNQQRIARAQALLRQGRLVQDVAIEVGYSSQPAFTRAFRAGARLSPRDWLARDNGERRR